MHFLFSRSIRQFLLLMMLLALAPALVIISLSALDRYREATAQTEGNLVHLVESLALHQESLVLSTRQFLATLGKVPSIQSRDKLASQYLLSELHKGNPHYVNILTADLQGFIYANAINAPGFSVADRKYFKDVLTTHQFASGEYVISRSTNKPVLNFAAPVYDTNEQLVAVVIVGLDLSYYDRLLAQTQLPYGTTITLTDHRGIILHRSPQTGNLSGTPDPAFSRMNLPNNSGIFHSDSDSGQQLTAWKRLALSDTAAPYLYIRLSVPQSVASQKILLVALRDISLLILVAIVALSITWVVGNRGVAQPIRMLADATAEIGKGMLQTRVPHIAAPQELERLMNGFNDMAATLAQRQQQQAEILRELAESEEKYRIVADYTLDWEYWLGPHGEVLYMSPATLELTGYHRDEFYADAELLNRIFHPDDREWMASHVDHGSGDDLFKARDVRIITRDGQERWVAHICQPVTNSLGEPMGRRGCNRDVTDRKLAELALHQKSEELTEFNRTLQQRVQEELSKNREMDRMLMIQGRQAAMGEMISNIAHQWRQPLNNLGLMIQGLMLDYDYGELSRDHLQTSVQHGMDLIQYMSSTIDDFRNFFKPNKVKSCFSLQAVASRAITFVSASLEDSRIAVKLQVIKDATTCGYPNECTQVLINLLGNARDVLQERRPETPCITVTIDDRPAGPTITVHDNGGGITDEIQERIFDPYFTTKEQGKGTGIGLYMAKTIIERNMGGSLTACNDAGGALFTLTLPPAEDETAVPAESPEAA